VGPCYFGVGVIFFFFFRSIHSTTHSFLLSHTRTEYLSPKETMTVHASAVYALYLVYFTQPTSLPKVPIRLTMNTWNLLQSIYKHAFTHKASDLT
jgi:hypothetical protein